MNIFFLDTNPRLCATYYTDTHVCKIPTEIAQMLATRFSFAELANAPLTKAGTVRKHSYRNHPMTRWVGGHSCNAGWALQLGIWLLHEQQKRQFKLQLTNQQFFNWCLDYLPLKETPHTPPPGCFGTGNTQHFATLDEALAAHRTYYTTAKAHLARWSVRERPFWFPPRNPQYLNQTKATL